MMGNVHVTISDGQKERRMSRARGQRVCKLFQKPRAVAARKPPCIEATLADPTLAFSFLGMLV